MPSLPARPGSSGRDRAPGRAQALRAGAQQLRMGAGLTREGPHPRRAARQVTCGQVTCGLAVPLKRGDFGEN